MTSRERVEAVLNGQKPDMIPIMPIYDHGYVLNSIGVDPRMWFTQSTSERVDWVEKSFLLHDVDGFFVHSGYTEDIYDKKGIEKLDDYWIVTEKTTGIKRQLKPDCSVLNIDGRPLTSKLSAGWLIKTIEDTGEYFANNLRYQPEAMSGRMAPLKHLSQKYPDHHFSVQIGSPFPHALDCCGGFVEGLTTMAENRQLFRQILDRCSRKMGIDLIRPAKQAGAKSIWFTSYYTGADTISPKDYLEVVFPFEYEICKAAKDAGLYVLNWFLGDLMPILDDIMKLPIDALVLEQGRKGYTIDPVEIRKTVGSKFCLFGYVFENDFCVFNKNGIEAELRRQIDGTAAEGAFIAGTPIMPPNAKPKAVDYYFSLVRKYGKYYS